MISKSVSLVIALLTLVGLAAPTGVMLPLQTARAQIGDGDDGIANIVDDALNTAFSAAGIDGEEEEEDEEEETATEEEEEAAVEAEDQSGDDNQDIDQTQDQQNEQEQDADQEVDQENDQSETNIQANELDTGDNTATIAQSNDADEDDDQDGGQDVAAEASDEEEDSDSTDADATAEAIGIVDQSNTATIRQNSSINDVDLSNNVAFGDDTNTQIAVPIIDQDQRAANLAEQRAANLDLDIVRVQQPTPTPTTQPPEEEEEQPPAGTCDPSTTDCFCFAIVGEPTAPRCFDTELECIIARGNEVPPPGTEFTPCVEVGPG
jgi:hypothetical protein